MFAKTYGATTLGIDGRIIDVEVDVSPGLPGFELVGLPDTSVKESKERVRTAIRNSGIQLRQERVTVNLAPADVRKDSSGLDLPIAVGLLASYGMVPEAAVQGALFSAELSLDGNCRPISGILPMAITAREHGLTEFYVAPSNADEALLIDGLKVFAVENLAQLVRHLTGTEMLTPSVPKPIKDTKDNAFTDDFADVQGQYQAKRALEIAAAGGHNVLMVGVPGSGKTMLARRMSSILPELTKEEAIEITKIYSISGLLGKDTGLVTTRPFRSPHHTSSTVAMIGGGSIPRPGEVTLAHHGVLFLDELPEFSKKTLEVLREPIEDRQITVSRANATLTFPSSIILVAAMNEVTSITIQCVEVIRTLNKALGSQRKRNNGLILYSDQGNPYTSKTFTDFCEEQDLTQSMSKAGCPYDNAPMERYFNTLKNEEIYLHEYHDEESLY